MKSRAELMPPPGQQVRARRMDGQVVSVFRVTLHDGQVEWVEGVFDRQEEFRGYVTVAKTVKVRVSVSWSGYPDDLSPDGCDELVEFLGPYLQPAAMERFKARLGARHG